MIVTEPYQSEDPLTTLSTLPEKTQKQRSYYYRVKSEQELQRDKNGFDSGTGAGAGSG